MEISDKIRKILALAEGIGLAGSASGMPSMAEWWHHLQHDLGSLAAGYPSRQTIVRDDDLSLSNPTPPVFMPEIRDKAGHHNWHGGESAVPIVRAGQRGKGGTRAITPCSTYVIRPL